MPKGEYKRPIGNKAHYWKGGVRKNKTYRKIHKWIEHKLGKPEQCEICKKDGLTGHQIHWANLSGKYLLKVKDWIRLCVKCHKRYDIGKLPNQ
jgi:hypothetical protein